MRYRFSLLLILLFVGFVGNGQGFGPQQIISSNADYAWAAYAADLDGDGDEDVLSVSEFDDKLVWYKNDGVGNFGSELIFSGETNAPRAVFAADLDGDNDLDVIFGSYLGLNKIAWYENDGLGNFGAQQVITNSVSRVTDLYFEDLDADGDLDLLTASYIGNEIAWFENDGTGLFGTKQVITTAATKALSVHAEDLDNDGDFDVLSASEENGLIAWYENDGSSGFGPQQTIQSGGGDLAYSVYTGDMDNDGFNDVLSALKIDLNDDIIWHRNNGDGTFSDRHIDISVVGFSGFASDVYMEDFDRDGNNDLLYGIDNSIYWFKNNGFENFSSEQLVTTNANSIRSLFTADFDDDGDFDILSASRSDDKIAWYENLLEINIEVFILNAPCLNSSNGALQIYVSDPSLAPYMYSWVLNDGEASGSGSIADDVFTIEGLSEGGYDILVIDANGDSAQVENFELAATLESYFEIIDIATTNSTNGLDNGAISLTVDGGDPNYIFTWSGPSSGSQSQVATTFSINNIPTGIYTITVTESGNSISTYTVTLLDETIPQSTCENPLDVVILNDASGSVDIIEHVESKQFFVDFINALNVGPNVDDAKISLIEWSSISTQEVRIPMTGNLSQLQNYVNLSRNFGGGTHPHNAMRFGKDYFRKCRTS